MFMIACECAKTLREKRKGKDNRDEQKKENKKRRKMKKHFTMVNNTER